MGFPRKEHWNGLPLPSPGDLPNPGIKPVPPALAGEFFTTELLYNTGNYIQCLVITYKGKESEKVYVYIYIYMSACMLSRFSRVRLCVMLWTVAHQALLSMGFSRQEYRNGLPCPPPGDLPNPGIKPVSHIYLQWQAGSSPLVPAGPQCRTVHDGCSSHSECNSVLPSHL